MSKKKLLITEDGSHTIFLPELNETYHSTHGAIQESQYVFINQGLDFKVQRGLSKARVFEVGFGTGLNALLSLMYAQEHQISIQYQTIEAYPLDLNEVSKLNYTDQIKVSVAVENFMKLHQMEWNSWIEISAHFRMKKIKGKIQELPTGDQFDVCYFDAFAPSKQREMWEIPILEKVKNSLVSQGVFVTYCAKGQLKRDLRDIGFEVETLPGPPGKKEMVRAIKI